MKMLDKRLLTMVETAVDEALSRSAAPIDIRWKSLRPTDDVRWDVSINAALTWAASTREDAVAMARRLADLLSGNPVFSHCEAAEPGFVNIRIDDGILTECALAWVDIDFPVEYPLLPPDHPMTAGPPFIRRMTAMTAMNICPDTDIDADRTPVRRLLWCLISIRAGLEEGKPDRKRLLSELMMIFEACHRSRLVSRKLCRAVLRAADSIIRTEDEKGDPQ